MKEAYFVFMLKTFYLFICNKDYFQHKQKIESIILRNLSYFGTIVLNMYY